MRNPPYFDGMSMTPTAVADIRGARVLALLGDSVTTDHISPAGNIAKSSPAAKYLVAQGVQPVDFNSYGARRGNHEVMMRGTFANIRLRNNLAPGTEGGVTVHVPSGEQLSIYDAAMRYKDEGTPLLVIAGKEYGTGSSRDWAAKGTMLLGVRAVIAESYERIHRSNLIGMGVLPLQFRDGESAQSLGLTGQESYEIIGLNGGAAKQVTVVATRTRPERRSASRRACGSTRPRSASTSSTAASCTTSCVSSRVRARPPDRTCAPGARREHSMFARFTFLLALVATTVLAAPTLEAPPTAGIGAPVAVKVTGSSNPRDFVTIVPKDAREGAYDAYQYVAKPGVLKLTAPAKPGEYEIRLLAADSPYPTLARRPIRIDEVKATLEGPDRGRSGQEIPGEVDRAGQRPRLRRDRKRRAPVPHLCLHAVPEIP